MRTTVLGFRPHHTTVTLNETENKVGRCCASLPKNS